MKIETRKEVIESILINAQAFLEKKDATNITSHIYIDVTNSREAIIKATDNEIGLVVRSDKFEIIETGVFTVNGKKLLDIVRTLKDDTIQFLLKEGTLIIKQRKTLFKLPTFNPEEYPTFPEVVNKSRISLDSEKLIKSLKKINPAIDSNNPKFELNGALIDIKKDKTLFVGTDTKRLAVIEIQQDSEKELSLIVPKKTISEIQKLFIDKIDIYYDENFMIIQNSQFYLFSKLINGKFPTYEKIIPKETSKSIELPKDKMIESMKIVTTISNEIEITLEDKTITLKSLNAPNQEAITSFEIEENIGDKFTFGVNSKFLFDFLNQIDKDKFILGLNEPTLPFIVKSDNFLTVIMPII
jgi:DNA polymerase-3 subunit beta